MATKNTKDTKKAFLEVFVSLVSFVALYFSCLIEVLERDAF